MDVPRPEGLARQIHGQGVVLTVGNEIFTDRGVGGGVGDVPRAEEQVGDPVALAVGGGDHVGDLNDLVVVGGQHPSVHHRHVGILSLDRQGGTLGGGVEGDGGVVAGYEMGGALADGQIQQSADLAFGVTARGLLVQVGVGVLVGGL